MMACWRGGVVAWWCIYFLCSFEWWCVGASPSSVQWGCKCLLCENWVAAVRTSCAQRDSKPHPAVLPQFSLHTPLTALIAPADGSFTNTPPYESIFTDWAHKSKFTDWAHESIFTDWAHKSKFTDWAHESIFTDWAHKSKFTDWAHESIFTDWAHESIFTDWAYESIFTVRGVVG